VKDFSTDKIRTFCLAGQRGSGKTSLADAIAYVTGVNSRIGRVDDGSSLLDYYENEIARRTSISAKVMACTHKDGKINVLDCPGHPDFVGELLSAVAVSDAIGIVIDATSGVQIGTQVQWRSFPAANTARFFFVNKMEKENVKWRQNLDSIRGAFGKGAAAVFLPIGEAESFSGLVDLLHMKAYTFDADGKQTETQIPADMKADVDKERENLVEVAAEADDALLEKFLGEGTLTDAELRQGLLKGITNGSVYPILFGSAARNIGTRLLLDFVIDYLPSPNQMPALRVTKTGTENGLDLPCDPNGKSVAFIFKVVSEGHLGDMSFFRAVSGTIRPGLDLSNQKNGSTNKIAQVFTFQGKNRTELTSVAAGDIGVLVKLKDVHTNNTLADKDFSVTVPPIQYPNPVMDVAIRPKSKGDEEKISVGLHRLQEEDPTFRIIMDAALRQQVLYGQGATHIEVLAEKLHKRFGVDIELGKPKIPYRETIKGKTEKQYKHKKQSGGRGQYGDVYLRIEPNVRGGGFEFNDEISGGVIPGKYVPAVEKGVVESMEHGGLAGAQVVDVKVALYYGSYHDVDSSDMAFKIAGLMAFKEGFLDCKPVLLEPIFAVEILVPDDYTGDVMGDLSSRRGKISGMDPEGRSQKIKATVPQSELYQYSVQLRSMTQGQGVFSVAFSHYEEVPHEIAQKIIAEAKAEKEAEAK
jgi:elongation factor G